MFHDTCRSSSPYRQYFTLQVFYIAIFCFISLFFGNIFSLNVHRRHLFTDILQNSYLTDFRNNSDKKTLRIPLFLKLWSADRQLCIKNRICNECHPRNFAKRLKKNRGEARHKSNISNENSFLCKILIFAQFWELLMRSWSPTFAPSITAFLCQQKPVKHLRQHL